MNRIPSNEEAFVEGMKDGIKELPLNCPYAIVHPGPGMGHLDRLQEHWFNGYQHGLEVKYGKMLGENIKQYVNEQIGLININ